MNLKSCLHIINLSIFTLSIIFYLGSATAQTPSKEILRKIGKELFFDKNLSFNRTKSCSSCHDPKFAFTDGYRRSLGATGDMHMRNASTLINISDYESFTMGDPRITTLEMQIRGPLFNTAPIELGVTGFEQEVLSRFVLDTAYIKLFKDGGISISLLNWDLIISALAEYVRDIRSYDSKYDRFVKSGDTTILDASEQRGMKLFFSEALGCTSCHAGKNFNTPKNSNEKFFNNGFFRLDETHTDTKFKPDLGLALVTNKDQDIGKFRIPTLRNITITSPYMHNGTISTLEEVIAIYGKGGINKVNISSKIKGFSISKNEIKDLISFFGTLRSEVKN